MKKIILSIIMVLVLATSVYAGQKKYALLEAVTATGASTTINVEDYRFKSIYITASSVTTGGTVKIQTSYDNSNWVDLNETTVSADGTTEVAINEFVHRYIRVNLTARTDGTYTVSMIVGD